MFALIMKSKLRRTQAPSVQEGKTWDKERLDLQPGDNLKKINLPTLYSGFRLYSCFFCSVVCFGKMVAAIFKDFRDKESQNK